MIFDFLQIIIMLGETVVESGLELPKIDALPTFTSAFTSSIVSNTTTTLTKSPEKYANLTSSSSLLVDIMQEATQIKEKLSNQRKRNPSVTLPDCNSASNSLPTLSNETIFEMHQLHENNLEAQRNTPTHRSIIPDPSTSLISGLKNKKDQNKKLCQSKKKPTKKGIWKVLFSRTMDFSTSCFFLFNYFSFFFINC